ncbi:GH1 family beta-glucosidase [Paracoccus sp. p4-l81]|uniref:GH1 family beta-glucosidase n=1 Tax=unclassified Paracoccus (in: a-proteobacteria) TaxID=2688777 RepID=UPI0035BA4703
MTALPPRSAFPPGFLFGAATSSHQIEGSEQGGAGPSHWDTFAATPGTIVDGSDARLACDHLRHWQGDLDLVAGAGLDIYRFSISWPRVLPQGTGAINAEGLAFYDRLVDGMLARGLKPALTLYHWDLPAALADRGGWTNRDTALRMADYAALIARHLGDRLWSTAPVNEPWCVAWLSHFLGAHAPGLRDIRAAARATHHILLAHGLSIAALRAEGLGNLGAVVNLEQPIPADAAATTATARFDAIMNRLFLEPMFQARYPDLALEGLAPHLPDGWQDDMATIAAPLDWLGINYYTCKRIAAAPGLWPAYAEAPAQGPLTSMGWERHPQGLTALLARVARDYSGALPLLVTENGTADPMGAPAGTDDGDRIAYLAAHLDAARQAIAQGVPLAGYIVWSLMDNFEWALGYGQCFGLVAVDRASLRRTPKASYHALAQAMRQ